MARIPVVGGPHCGQRAAEAANPHRWIDEQGGGHSQPGEGRSLYLWRDGQWNYAGAGARICGCGTILFDRYACPFCAEGKI